LVETLFKAGDVVPVGTVIAYFETETEKIAATPPPVSAPVASNPTAMGIAAPKSEPAVATFSAFGSTPVPPPSVAAFPAPAVKTAPVASATPSFALSEPVEGRIYSPLVMTIAQQEGISGEELKRIPGTGEGGRVTKKDILLYVEAKKKGDVFASAPAHTPTPVVPSSPVAAVPTPEPVAAIPAPATPPFVPKPEFERPTPPPATQEWIRPATEPVVQVELSPRPAVELPEAVPLFKPSGEPAKFVVESRPHEFKPKSYTFTGNAEVMEMDRMRKIIAENMAYSKHVSPHVTSFVEADVTHMVMWRERNKDAFEKKYNEKLTYTPLFVEALVKAIRDFPMVNVSVDGDKILVKKDVNISLAVALPSGNLIVPTLRNADRLSLAGLAAAVNDLTDRARKNKLSPNDIADGTYTLSNVGTFGNVMGTPIIMQPQAAVLAVGAIRKKPAVVETPTGDVIAIRHMMFLSHSYDHRIIDGMLGGSFVRRVADYLESFDIQREV
jgi:2-oxoglutarate dehydrogenase E2 component (dihydrolipoamide succinyltransferase)